MLESYRGFLGEKDDVRRAVFQASAQQLQVPPGYIEKDFWVCMTLDVLFNSDDLKKHKLLFKGGTALSKGYGLIKRFSEDIDIVVFRESLGFDLSQDPTNRELDISNKARKELFEKLRANCQAMMYGELSDVIKNATSGLGCEVYGDADDKDGQTVLVKYPSLFPESGYVRPIVKIEGGAKSGLTPHNELLLKPYIADVVSSIDFNVPTVRTIDPKRTFWEKVLILHGLHCGFRDEERLPGEENRLSRHYYDVAMLCEAGVAEEAMRDMNLLNEVREHNLNSFNQRWKRFDEAVPGTIMVTPQPELSAVLRKDYQAMSEMIMGDVPEFDQILNAIQLLNVQLNSSHAERHNI